MLGAVQLGLLAASVVLFVPMGMAGWHLSRNKMLFFSCALFITLAVGVHLMPYLVSYSSFLPLSDVPITSSFNRDSCLSSLHDIAFRDVSGCDTVDSSCGKKKSWDWVDAECEFHRLGKSDVSVLLNGSWIVIAGDSQARLMAVSLLELVMGSDGVDKIRSDLFKRHSDYSVVVDGIGMKLDFVWAPFIANLTEFMGRVRSSNGIPDVVVIGSGLWDMLHIHNVSDYGASLREFRNSALTLLPVSSNTDTSEDGSIRSKPNWLLHLFWVGMPKLVTEMLNTAEKRQIMTELMCQLYDDEVVKSNILRKFGGPFWKLDVRSLSESCGAQCTADGMHYDAVVYDAAVQILLNVLLIESNQQTL